jgi:DNA topoisomerase-1
LDDEGQPVSLRKGPVQYYAAKRGGSGLLVVSALGHLYSLTQVRGGWNYPVYEMKWVPANQADRANKRVNAYIETISALSKGIDRFVSACDYDQEGSLIAYNVLRYAVGEHSLAKSRRILYSTLTRRDLTDSWKNMEPTLDYPVIAAGKTRHEVDWLFGINLSRALTLAVRKASDAKKTLSIGRVQGPTLSFVKERESAIRGYVPLPYWRVYAETTVSGETIPLEYEKKRLEREVSARELASKCRGRDGRVVEVNKRSERVFPPPPFNLGDLQREAYRVFKLSPMATLRAAEKLYLGTYISYPRTSSQRLPPALNLREILEQFSEKRVYSKLAEELLKKKSLRPRQGKKDDPAHPAIHPTGAKPGRLNEDEAKIYDLIVKRFLSCLGMPAVREKIDAEVDVNGHRFYMRGMKTIMRGWLDSYAPYLEDKETVLPEVELGMVIPVTKFSTRRRYTKPPRRYNPSSLLRQMESHEIGTKATRANIIDTLYKRGYLTGKRITATDLGLRIAETLEEYCPSILSVETTRELEASLEGIHVGERNPETVVEGVKEALTPILAQFKKREGEIGAAIAEAVAGGTIEEEPFLNGCRVCGRDKRGDAVYCERHQAAYGSLEEYYPQWRRAFGLSWREYLEKVSRISGTGIWVKGVIKDILSGG